MTTAVSKLLDIAELIALQECEGVAHGQAPCPLESDYDDDWCLPCLAKKAVEQFWAE